jgi:outer membrane immunogenic protein
VKARVLEFAAIAALICTPAYAIAPTFTWTGFYIGVNAGYVTGDNGRVWGTPLFGDPILIAGPLYNDASAAAVSANYRNSGGLLGGGQAGFNYQFAPGWVIGVEADIDGVMRRQDRVTTSSRDVPGFAAFPLTTSISTRHNLRNLGTARARVGFLVMQDVLLFGTGGFAFGESNTRVTVDQFVPSPPLPNVYGTTLRSSSDRTGYAAGGGFEFAFAPDWTAKVEALYYDLGSKSASGQYSNFSTATVPPSVFTTTGINSTVEDRGVVARFGVNYQINLFGSSP